MQVETYEIEELVTGRDATEVEEEALLLIEQLDLGGQRTLITTDEDDGTRARIPYPKLSDHEQAVYHTRFPVAVDVAGYDVGIIPVRVLQVVAHAREQFDLIQVWHNKAIDPDPLLIGILKHEPFLLARWGEALVPFSRIVEEAREFLKESWTKKGEACQRECAAFLTAIDGRIENRLQGKWVETPWV